MLYLYIYLCYVCNIYKKDKLLHNMNNIYKTVTHCTYHTKSKFLRLLQKILLIVYETYTM